MHTIVKEKRLEVQQEVMAERACVPRRVVDAS